MGGNSDAWHLMHIWDPHDICHDWKFLTWALKYVCRLKIVVLFSRNKKFLDLTTRWVKGRKLQYVTIECELTNIWDPHDICSDWKFPTWAPNNTAQQNKGQLIILKICNFEDFCVLNLIGTFVLLYKLVKSDKMGSKIEKKAVHGHFRDTHLPIGGS